MTYRVEFKKSAAREYAALPKPVQARISELIKLLSLSPFSSALDIKKLRGEDSLYRARTGDYRVLYEVEKTVLCVVVIKVGHRREIYR